jgi:hypothetical protein
VEQVEALERCLSELVIALRLGERARLERHCRELRAELAMHEDTLAREKLSGEVGQNPASPGNGCQNAPAAQHEGNEKGQPRGVKPELAE